MSDTYIDRYREQGFAVVKGVFSRSEIADMAAAFDEIYRDGIAAHPRSYRHGNVFYAVADDANLGRVIRMVQWPSYFNTVLDRVRLDRRVYDIVAPLIGPDVKQIINQLHWKPPGAAMVEFGYHQDSKSRRPREAYRDLAASYVQTGIAIDPHRADNGAMKVYPGSHLIGEVPYDPNRRTMHRAAQDDDLTALGLDPAKLVTLEMEPGDFALWHVYTIHGSGPNLSDIDRRLYINGYVTAANCDRGEWAFRGGKPCKLGDPVLVHYEQLHERPEPHYID
jgi:ectoine hydroxylase-related dioxygenase (phytanoyl-CoA dioxygenase family)